MNKKKRSFLTAFRDFFTTSTTRVIVLAFAFIILVGGFLLSTPLCNNSKEWLNFSDALFTATSAVCVTGLTVVDTSLFFNFFGQLIILILIQIGGLGVMTVATIIFMLLRKKITLKDRMVIQESLSHQTLQGTLKLIIRVIKYTFIIEGMGAFLLFLSFIPRLGAGNAVWAGIFHSVSAFCNAGFDVLGKYNGEFSSLTAYQTNILILLPIMMLIVLGGLGFAVLNQIITIKKTKRLTSHAKVVLIATATLIIVGWVVFTLTEWNHAFSQFKWYEKILLGLFQSITPRTAGFDVIGQASLTNSSEIMTMILMFVGASPASTGGGIKVTTLVILVLMVWGTLTGKQNVNLVSHKVTNDIMRRAVSTVVLAFIVVLATAFSVAWFERYNSNAIVNTHNILFESISAFSTVGLSNGITPFLTNGSKFVLGITMFIGRVGPITMGLAIALVGKKPEKLQYPDIKIMIG